MGRIFKNWCRKFGLNQMSLYEFIKIHWNIKKVELYLIIFQPPNWFTLSNNFKKKKKNLDKSGQFWLIFQETFRGY